MPELEMTWARVIRIWWAAFWRGFIFANLFSGVIGGIIGVTLVVLGHRDWSQSPWLIYSIMLSCLPAWLMGVRLALRAKYKEFRIVLIAAQPAL